MTAHWCISLQPPPIGVITSPVETVFGIAATDLTYPVDAAGSSITAIATSGDIA